MLESKIAKLVAYWFDKSGFAPITLKDFQAINIAVGSSITTSTPEQRTLLAAAYDLARVLSTTPEGRQALLNLGFEPLSKNTKGE